MNACRGRRRRSEPPCRPLPYHCFDIVLTFFVAYLDKTSYLLIDSRKTIAWRYLSTWFLLDLASTVPSEIARRVLPHKLGSYGFFNMLRLWRLRRVSSLFAQHDLMASWFPFV
ncbi:hypothetical protein BHE74_00010688 [Ensete ventricosum]|nr:hypothetical protein BHE74_00010688 [Ensete ventricosum]